MEVGRSNDLVNYFITKRFSIHCNFDNFGEYSYNPIQPMPITTDVVSLNLDQGKVYNIMR
jgi:hypothetical protein